jgi:hypothetical protein
VAGGRVPEAEFDTGESTPETRLDPGERVPAARLDDGSTLEARLDGGGSARRVEPSAGVAGLDGGCARRPAGGNFFGFRLFARCRGFGGRPPVYTVIGWPAYMPNMICPHRTISRASSGQSHVCVELCSRPHASAVAPAIA